MFFGVPIPKLQGRRANEAHTSSESEPPHAGSHTPANAAGGRRASSPAAGRWVFLLLCALASCALAGCAFLQPRADPTRFYVLTVPSAPPKPAAKGEFKRWRVRLQPVAVPAYLRSRAMVVRTGTNEIHFADFDRWAEPLGQGISRVLKEAISSAPNVEEVTLNPQGDGAMDYEVAVGILACEGVRLEKGGGSIRFVATWDMRSVGNNPTATSVGTRWLGMGRTMDSWRSDSARPSPVRVKRSPWPCPWERGLLARPPPRKPNPENHD
jgi:uncharacterized lipoprotein YmbA